MTNEWTNPEHAQAYLARMRNIPHRESGEATLLSELPDSPQRVLDLGCGNGHLLDLVLTQHPEARGVGIDFSPTMLAEAGRRFANSERVQLVDHNLDESLPDLGDFDCIISSFAIHHCTDERKESLYREIFERLTPEGIFCNLEHVASPNGSIHQRFVSATGMAPEDEDPSNKLLDVETQLDWLREIGFVDVDCFWKWRELALLAGRKPRPRPSDDTMTIDEDPTEADTRFVDTALKNYNKNAVGYDDFKPLQLSIRDSNGQIVAGLNGLTGWQWLYVQILWVHEPCRHGGLGTRLLDHAEHLARQRGCLGACLSSFSFQAPEFYKRRGYQDIGRIESYPDEHTMYFLTKRFSE